MNDNRLSKGRLIGYIALFVLNIVLAYMAIYYIPWNFRFLPAMKPPYWEKGEMTLYIWYIILLVTVTLLCAAVLLSFVFHFAQLVRRKNERLILSSVLETAVLFFVAAFQIFFVMVSDTSDFGGCLGIEYATLCSVFSFLAAGIAFAMLGINIFKKKEFDKKFRRLFYAGIGIVFVLALMIFIPTFVVIVRKGC